MASKTARGVFLVRATRLLLAAAPLLVSGVAAEESVKAGINDAFLAPQLEVAEWVERFEGESREIFRLRREIVDALTLQPGMSVADVGAGTGLFVPLLAGAVDAQGQVFAVEISPGFAAHLRDRVAEARLENVSVVLAPERSVTLPAGSIDLVFLCDVYPHFEYPNDSLASIWRALRPGGRLVVLDFERIPGVSRDFILEHVRAGKQTFTDEIRRAGFELVGEVELEGLEENYFLSFRKLRVAP